jgi:hypothetical protein
MIQESENAEETIFRTDFLAPVIREGYVRLRIAGILCQMVAEESTPEGWAILRPSSFGEAQVVRWASSALVASYLSLFPPVELRLVARNRDQWYGQAQDPCSPVRVEGLVPVRLAHRISLGDRIEARFDGQNFWFGKVLERGQGSAAPPVGASLADGRTLPEGFVRFQALDRDYCVRVEPSCAPPMGPGISLTRDGTLDPRSLAGIVRLEDGLDGRLTTSLEYTANWTLPEQVPEPGVPRGVPR